MKTALLVTLSVVTVAVGSTLAVMNNACKFNQHSWCAPVASLRHHVKHGTT
jgi:hypothetical protein